MTVAGLDVGTTGCKCTVFSETGEYLDRAYSTYEMGAMGESEVDCSALFAGVMSVLSDMAQKHPDIAALGITSFGETFVLTDASGAPLRPAMLYTSPRGEKECDALAGKIGEREIARITGLRPHGMYSLPKIMWVKNNEPDVFARAQYIFLISDYIGFMLTGERKIDYSLATRTMCFDVEALGWSDAMLAAAQVDQKMFSEPVPTGTCIGTVTKDAALLTGLSQSVKIVLAGHDQVAAGIGAGVFGKETAVDGAGTVECMTPVFDRRPGMETMFDGYYCLVPYLKEGTYVTYAFSYTGGALLSWCIETFAKKEKEQAEKLGISVNQYLEQLYAERRGNAPTGLLVLPHFAGAATPYMDTGAKGVILGLTLSTRVEDIYMACMEGIAFEMLLNMDALGDAVQGVKQLHATGGGAKSRVFMQLKADILNLPITSLKTLDAGTVGCAMQAGMAAGIYRDLDDAARAMVQKEMEFVPDPARHALFMNEYGRYAALYDAVRPLL